MKSRDNKQLSLRALAEPIERLAQANIALILTQAVIIRLSLELASAGDDDPDPLVLIGFLAACAVATVVVAVLSRSIRRFPRRWLRITIALGSLMLQASAFQLIHAWAS